jgi:hypothetical protein
LEAVSDANPGEIVGHRLTEPGAKGNSRAAV